jgi:hypothetical protein
LKNITACLGGIQIEQERKMSIFSKEDREAFANRMKDKTWEEMNEFERDLVGMFGITPKGESRADRFKREAYEAFGGNLGKERDFFPISIDPEDIWEDNHGHVRQRLFYTQEDVMKKAIGDFVKYLQHYRHKRIFCTSSVEGEENNWSFSFNMNNQCNACYRTRNFLNYMFGDASIFANLPFIKIGGDGYKCSFSFEDMKAYGTLK